MQGISCGSVHPYSPGSASGSGITSYFWTSFWEGCSPPSTSCGVHPLYVVPQFSPGSPRILMCVAGNGLHHCSPCRYMLMQAGHHCTPRTVSWKFRPRAHQQCAIVDCPHEVLEMMSVIHVQQGQGIRHAGLLEPVPLFSALVRGEAEDLIGDYDLFVGPLLLLDLVIDVKKFVQCEEEHLQMISISHHIFVMQ